MSATVCAECHHNMVDTGGENVCIKCGFVENGSNINESGIYDSSPVPNLFLSQAIGTGGEIPAGNDTDAVRRFFKGGLSPQKSLSCFSNACQKLKLHKHVQQEAWRLFQSISKKMPQKVAEHACIAIFHTCRKNGTSAPESIIIDAVKRSFGRKNMPTMAKMTYQHMDVIEYDGTRENEDKYYFTIVLMDRTDELKIPEDMFIKHKLYAWFLFTEAYEWDDNFKRRARRAVDQAFGLYAQSGVAKW